MIGQTLAHYKILEKIGSGGMGDVYLAEDTKLDRKVALKVLPPELAENKERRARFRREAKAIAALDHPNIVHVYSVEEADGIHFITMQLAHGKTLTQLLPENGFPLNKFFDVAIPLADAVAAAHQEGIVHRDLKPDNVMVGDVGQVKVLDFGLAKPQEGAAGSAVHNALTRSRTQEGHIVGTVAYMSPEQAQGEAVDHRSDLFSLGVVLYEMATGRHPFHGETSGEMLSSILRDDPVLVTEGNSELPRNLAEIIHRCLAKNPERRFQSAKDVRNELKKVEYETASGETVSAVPAPAKGLPRRFVWFVAAAGIATFWITSVLSRAPERTGPAILRLENPIQITSAAGVEDYPAWSPDGRTLAFSMGIAGAVGGGPADIAIRQLNGGPTLTLTEGRGQEDRYPTWSPDRSQIAFWSRRDGGGYFVMSALGGRPRRVMSIGIGINDTPSPPQWSSDGTLLAGVVYDASGAFIEIVSLATAESRRIAAPAGKWTRRYDLAWSPDGRLFAYVGAESPQNDVTELWVLDSKEGTAQPISSGSHNVWSPSWAPDGRTLYFVSNQGGAMDLWRQRIRADGLATGEAHPISSGVEMRRAKLSPDGTKIAYSKGRRVANVWRVPILPDRPATFSDAQQLTFDQAFVESVDVSPDGTRLALQSDREGAPDIWIMPATGGELQKITTGPTPNWYPMWSPSGDEFAFYSHRSGNRDIWVIPLVGGPARQLTFHEAQDFTPSWSPDGRYIAFHSGRSGNQDIWVIPADGGDAQQLTVHPAEDWYPHWSPDGNWLLFASDRSGENLLWRMQAATGEPMLLHEGRGGIASSWAPNGRYLYFIEYIKDVNHIWEVSSDGGTLRQVTNLTGRNGRIGITALSAHDDYLYFAWEERLGDIWVMDVVTDDSE